MTVKVIKAMDATAVLTPAVPFNFADIDEEAARLMAAAKDKARQMIAAAIEEANRVKSQARAEGAKEGQNEGLEKGHAEGLVKGRAQAAAAVAEQCKTINETLMKIADNFEKEKKLLLNQARQDMVRLAFAIAAKVIRRETSLSPDIAVRNVESAVELTANKTDITIRLSPADIASVQEFLPQLHRRFSDMKSVKVVADEAVSRGGCLLTTTSGSVDADIKTQMEEIEKALFGECK
jgi:flagellar assembly protein FliH